MESSVWAPSCCLILTWQQATIHASYYELSFQASLKRFLPTSCHIFCDYYKKKQTHNHIYIYMLAIFDSCRCWRLNFHTSTRFDGLCFWFQINLSSVFWYQPEPKVDPREPSRSARVVLYAAPPVRQNNREKCRLSHQERLLSQNVLKETSWKNMKKFRFQSLRSWFANPTSWCAQRGAPSARRIKRAGVVRTAI